MNERILIVLGSPNSPEGELSSIAKSRLDLCLKTYTENDLVLCTGGWGEHFNISLKPHAFYAKEYLLVGGISTNCFLDYALSGNTVEDAIKVKEIISTYVKPLLVVITSDFHVARTKLIFNKILKGYHILFLGAKVELHDEQHKTITEHEEKSVKNIIKNGLYY